MNIIKSLRLKTGELIACGLDANYSLIDFAEKQQYVTLHNPVIYSSFKFLDPDTNQIVDTISMSPYNGITDDRDITIQSSQIESISGMRSATRERYEQFVNQLDKYNKAGDKMLVEPQMEQPDLSDLETATLLMMPTDKHLH